MASTNKTQYYNLSQYLGSDKPTYLGDYNTDMQNIDRGIHEAFEKASANETHIGTLSNLETLTKENLVKAINELKTNLDNFNLTTYYNLSNITATGANITNNSLKLAKNSDGSLAKIYGFLSFTTPSAGDVKFVIANSGLAPASDIVINCAGILKISDQVQGILNVSAIDITIKTNGTIEIERAGWLAGLNADIILLPCLYFIKDFGDVPINA